MNRRQFYRVSFPKGAEISVRVGGVTYQVVDISESGIKIVGTGVPTTPDGTYVGEVIWYDGATTAFEGHIQRELNNQTALCEVEGIPYQRIIEEQRRLIREKRVPLVPRLKVFRGD